MTAETYRVGVTGSRTWAWPRLVYVALNDALGRADVPLVVVHGRCDPLDRRTRRRVPWDDALTLGPVQQAQLLGADWHASVWARSNAVLNWPLVSEEAVPADWDRLGRRAGPARNRVMVGRGAAEWFAFLDRCSRPGCTTVPRPHPSHGADGCAALAADAGIPVGRVYAP